MKTTKLLSSLIAVYAGILFLIPGHALAAAFGVSPPWIENETMKPGSSFVYVINLSANDLTDAMIVKPELTGSPELQKWITIQNANNLVLPEGQKIVPMSVNVNVPKDAKLGKYTGNLKLTLASKNHTADNIAILLGSNIAIKLDVTNKDVTDYWVQSISADPIREGDPINLKLSVKNLGNTDLTNILTKYSLVDMKTNQKMGSGSADTLSLPVYPQTMGEPTLTIMAPKLKMGEYWLDVEAFKDGKSAYKNRLYFKVDSKAANNAIHTAVEVPGAGWVKPAAEEQGQPMAGARVRTSVTVRAPFTNALIVVVIGILLVLTGVVVKIYMELKKRHR